MIGLLALLLGLTGVVYAAWPWLRGSEWPTPAHPPEVGAGADVDHVERALRAWSAAAGELGVEHSAESELTWEGEVGSE
ncbi:MAG: hypothetical protein PVJ43_01580 [Gemmatimonadales bacterium]